MNIKQRIIVTVLLAVSASAITAFRIELVAPFVTTAAQAVKIGAWMGIIAISIASFAAAWIWRDMLAK